MRKFEAGKEYKVMLGGDVRGTVKIVKRTAKFVTVEYWGKQVHKKLRKKTAANTCSFYGKEFTPAIQHKAETPSGVSRGMVSRL